MLDRVEAKVGDLLVPFISKADLIQNKLEIGRHRDLADVEELQAIPGDIFSGSFAPPPLPRPEAKETHIASSHSKLKS